MKTFKQYMTESKSASEFHHKLFNAADDIDVFHEAPGHVKSEIEKHGVKGTYGVFGTIGEPSGFVQGKKTVVHMKIPSALHHHIEPDMRYDSKDPHAAFMKEHPNMRGGDVSINLNRIPKQWIHKVEEKDS
jgi:hypothetical protein